MLTDWLNEERLECGRALGRVFNFRSDCKQTMHLLPSVTIRLNLELNLFLKKKKGHTPSISTVTITVYLKENGNKKKNLELKTRPRLQLCAMDKLQCAPRVRTPSSPVRERERKKRRRERGVCVREREKKKTEREGCVCEREREKRGRERKRKKEWERGMTSVLAPFSYLAVYSLCKGKSWDV